ncbi:insulinase family protein [Affinibrenneria salicis]|uniref:Insulinase family protein n=1 Tax=Affinibrenneria salicis TaxID=2590031 RepID=A0A5J5FX75_9GAMM|nr:pitrilysin family protein [Affinibrenneria salicis]KAA8998531.1 insulinase family protein [Affinibrenneria salicis]
MQGTKICLLAGGLWLAVAGGNAQAEALQPDPAWQQGKLDNGFTWQLLATPQRPGDRIELRLVVNAGSLVESAQQTGFAHFLPRLALTHSEHFTATQLSALWPPENGLAPPPAIASYDFTQYNLSLPNNRPELLKEALNWLVETAGQLPIEQGNIQAALGGPDRVEAWPANPQDPWWRYRLKGSTLLAHDPSLSIKAPVDAQQLQQFYKSWYTPDAMTLYVVGHVDSRAVTDMISKRFSALSGQRDAPAPVPTLSPLLPHPISLMNENLKQSTLSLVWDSPWQPIRESHALVRYWQSDLAREALFWHMQQSLAKNQQKGSNLRFDCNVLYTRAQCAIHLDMNHSQIQPGLTFLARELVNLRDNGLAQQEFDALIARKNDELSKLFTTYARTSTDILIRQRMRSQQNGVVDIAPEQYQQLRQVFLSGLTPNMLNQALQQQLAQDATLLLLQPQGEPEVDMKALQDQYRKIMTPDPAGAAPTPEAPDATDTPEAAGDTPPPAQPAGPEASAP